MTEQRRPKARLQYRDREGTRYEIGAVWAGRMNWSDDVQIQKEDRPGQYPRMRMSEAVRRVESGEGFINLVWPAEERREGAPTRKEPVRTQTRGKPAPRQYRDPDDDDEIPF